MFVRVGASLQRWQSPMSARMSARSSRASVSRKRCDADVQRIHSDISQELELLDNFFR